MGTASYEDMSLILGLQVACLECRDTRMIGFEKMVLEVSVDVVMACRSCHRLLGMLLCRLATEERC